jgi:excisionase family DNA binding protein
MKNINLIELSVDDLKKLISDSLKEHHSKREYNPPQINYSNYITRKETAKLLKISLTTLNEYSKQGIVPSYRVGNRRLYKLNEVENSLIQVKCIKYKRSLYET